MVEKENSGGMKMIAIDGWQNLMTKAGIAAFDKRVNSEFVLDTALSQGQIQQLYRGEGIAKKIVDIPPQDMVRQWINIEGDPENSIVNYLDKLNVRYHIKRALKWARLFGGSIMILGIDDGPARGRNLSSLGRALAAVPNPENLSILETPLQENNIKSIGFFRVYDRYAVSYSDTDLDQDPASPNFGNPVWYTIHPRRTQVAQFRVHYTRVLRFDGEDIDDHARIAENGWGDSSLMSVYTRIRGFANSLIATESIIDEFTIGVLTIKNLQDLIANGKENLITARLKQLDLSKHILNTMLVDDEEEFNRISATVNGIKDILEFLKDVLSAVSGIPQVKLFGEQTKGIGSSAIGNIRLYYDDIADKQRENLAPQLERLIELALKSDDFNGNVDEKWKLHFNKLWQQTEKEEAEVRHLVAKRDEIYLKWGAVTSKEVRESRFGGESYSSDMTLIEEEGNKLKTLPNPEPKKSKVPVPAKVGTDGK